MWLDVVFHILHEPVSLLLSFADMDRLRVYYENLDDDVIHKATAPTLKVHLKFGHPFVNWHTESRIF